MYTNRKGRHRFSLQFDKSQDNSARRKSPIIQAIKQFKQYKKTDRPMLNQQLKQKIKNKIETQFEALHKVRERQIQNNFYFNYNFNRFSNHLPVNEQKYMRKKFKQQNKSLVDVVQIINGQKPRDLVEYVNNNIKLQVQARQKQKQLYLMSQKNLNSIQKQRITEQAKKLQIVDKDYLQYKGAKKGSILDDQDQLISDLQIQQISSFKERNFYLNKNFWKINIFKIAHNDNISIGPSDQLKKYKFSYNSMIQKNYKVRLPIYSDISMETRKNMLLQDYKIKNEQQVLLDGVVINMDEIIFSNMLLVASNKISPLYLYRRLHQQVVYNKKNDDQSSQEELNEIKVLNRPNHKNAIDDQKQKNEGLNDLNNQDLRIEQQKYEIHAFRELLQNKADNQKEKYRKEKQKILKIKSQQNHLVSKSIFDLMIHSNLQKNIKDQLMRFMNIDQKQNKKTESKSISKSKSRKKSSYQYSISPVKIMAKQKKGEFDMAKLKTIRQLLDSKNKLQDIKNLYTRYKKQPRQRHKSFV